MNNTELIKEKPLLYFKGNNRKAVLILHGFAININQTDFPFNYFRNKGYTVARPVFPGHDGTKESLKKYGPNDWLAEAQRCLTKLSEEHDEIYLVGVSFGCNIGVSLCAQGNDKIKGIVLLEMPLFFNFRIWLILNILQPIFSLLGIDFIHKQGPLYRKNSVVRDGAYAFIPVRVSGLIRDYIRNVSRKEIDNIKVPVFIGYAEKSDLIDNRKVTEYICSKVPTDRRKIYCLPIDNHDLELLDEPNKILLLDKINKFISNIR